MNIRKKKLAIVGNGMGTCRLLDELVRRDATRQYEITVFGEERGGAYNRILLGKVLSGESPDAIVTKTPDWYDAHGIRLIQSTRVTRLDTLRKVVETADGQNRRYDVSILATGSQPLVPPLEGMRGEDGELRSGVFVYRTIADCIRMREYARSGDGAVIVGGGLLGLEAAKVLSDLGLHVTVVQSSKILMNAQLDEIAGEMLARQIERTGIFVRLGRTVESIYGDERVTGVVLDDGTTLSADMVVLACGVRPRVDIARASGLPVNKGILVNDTLATEVPGVYAFGECAEHRGKTYGIVTPVWEQAAVLADVLTGQSQARYRGSKLYTRLKVAGRRRRLDGHARARAGARRGRADRRRTPRLLPQVDRARRQAGGRHVGRKHGCDRHPGAALRSRRSGPGRSARALVFAARGAPAWGACRVQLQQGDRAGVVRCHRRRR